MSVLSTMISLMMKVLFVAALDLVFFFSVSCATPVVAALTALASSTKAPSKVFVFFIEGLRKDGDVDNLWSHFSAKIAFSVLIPGTFVRDKVQKTL